VTASREFVVMAKPTGAICNMDCHYCYYLQKERLYPENEAFRMKEDLGTRPRVYYLPGHGQDVGRSAFTKGLIEVEWPWTNTTEGAKTWKRSGR